MKVHVWTVAQESGLGMTSFMKYLILISIESPSGTGALCWNANRLHYLHFYVVSFFSRLYMLKRVEPQTKDKIKMCLALMNSRLDKQNIDNRPDIENI